MRIVLMVGSCALFPIAVAAQARYEPTSGDYFVTVHDDDGRLLEMRIEPPNKVRVGGRVSLTPGTARRYRYAYRVEVSGDSRQPLELFELDCPSQAGVYGLRASSHYEGNPLEWAGRHDDWEQRESCSFDGPAAGLSVGGTVEASFESDWLPAIGKLRAFGKTADVVWPTTDPHPDNASLRPLVDSLSGIAGGWWSTPAVVPLRDPRVFAAPAVALRLLRGDLAEICGTLLWVTQQGVCNSLQVKLIQAARSFDRGHQDVTRGQLEAFLAELDAQHGAQPGKHVSDNAYWLLRVNAEYLLSRM